MCTNVGNAPANSSGLRKERRHTASAPKGAYVEETVYLGADQIDALASIKSKNELIADVVALLQSPMQNVMSALNAGSKLQQHPRRCG